jgi:NADPH oxidase 2
MFLWISANIAIFAANFNQYHNSPQYYCLRQLINDGLSVARASSRCLNFNCCLILLPVCRNVLSLIRYIIPSFLMRTRIRRWVMRLLDHHIEFHRCVGYAICFWTFVHVGAHIYNYESLIDARRKDLQGNLKHVQLDSCTGNITLNPFDQMNFNSLNISAMLKTTAGWTGIILVVCLLMIFTSSTLLIRRSFYEIFWFIHHIFVVFFIFLMIHGSEGIIRAQINSNQQSSSSCSQRQIFKESDHSNACLQVPCFRRSVPSSWIWVIGPLSIYIIERLIRLKRSLQPVTIIDIIGHKPNVIEIRFDKVSIKTPKPGQYIYLKFFSLAKFEWHPFTVTSAPQEDFISVHIRVTGNWTRELSERLQCSPSDFPKLSVDGPYGSPADDIFDYDSVILVGAGIGGKNSTDNM